MSGMKNLGDNNYERGILAATMYLERSGFTIIETDVELESGALPILAQDEDTIVLVGLEVTRDKKTEEWPVNVDQAFDLARARSEFEQKTVRFDRIKLLVLAEDRALLRHERNIGLGEDGEQEVPQ